MRTEERASADQLHAFIERCQVCAGIPVTDPGEACTALVGLVRFVPRHLRPAQQAVAHRVLNGLWVRVLRALTADTSVARGVEDARVAEALAAIERRYAEPGLRLQHVARELGLSPTHLTHILKRATGRTFGAHLRTRRVSEARALLAQSALSIKEVASRVGFATTSQLDRHFKRSVGRSPSAYRTLVRRSTPADGVTGNV
ncbi:MAG: helix-turn-helix domain-containing protein [Vicinamibacterales bacterium]